MVFLDASLFVYCQGEPFYAGYKPATASFSLLIRFYLQIITLTFKSCSI